MINQPSGIKLHLQLLKFLVNLIDLLMNQKKDKLKINKLLAPNWRMCPLYWWILLLPSSCFLMIHEKNIFH